MTGKPIKGQAKPAKGWKLSDKLATDQDSLYAVTLRPLYDNPSKYTSVLYNDDPPGHGAGNGYRAHAKGVLAMDGETGIWLIHSVPGFVAEFDGQDGYKYPESGRLNGQTLMCISFKTKDEGNDIAEQLSYMVPNIYAIQITDEVEALADKVRVLETKKWPKDSPQHMNEINSIKGEQFMSFARSNKAGGDLYSQYVAPELGSDLMVETWRRGAGNPLESNCTAAQSVMNIQNVNLKLVDSAATETTPWSYISDHAKWAVTTDDSKPFACIGDINRMASQYKRGGGTVCFKHPDVHKVVKESVSSLETCERKQKSG